MLDKKLFDSEYSTQWREEVEFLKSVGIPYTFVIREASGINRYKYQKNAQLFKQLSVFYEQKNK